MATHDDGPHSGPLKPGMVFTIEPALRVPEEVLRAARRSDRHHGQGRDVLSDFVPRDIPSIEKVMKEDGLLERYPRPD